MTETPTLEEIITFSPGLQTGDALASFWLGQVTVRMRREICWCWRERGLSPDGGTGTLPPFADRVASTLDMRWHAEEKQEFFSSDPAARHLSDQLLTEPPAIHEPAQGSFCWVVDRLGLDDVSTFVLAMGLAVACDSAMGAVVAACLNDPTKTRPNLALAQKLWDRPEEILRIGDSAHPLFRSGVMQPGEQTSPSGAEIDWDQPITVPALVAEHLLLPDTTPPQVLRAMGAVQNEDLDDSYGVRLTASKVAANNGAILQVIPICGPEASAHRDSVRHIARLAGRRVNEFTGDPRLLQHPSYLNSLATLCWLRGEDLYLSHTAVSPFHGEHQQLTNSVLPTHSIPITLYLGVTEAGAAADLPTNVLLPTLAVPQISYHERVAHWKEALGPAAASLGEEIILENARRFRFERQPIDAVANALKGLPQPLSAAEFTAACRAEIGQNIGELGQLITPRFQDEALVLPGPEARQFEEIVTAMRMLTQVHYGWGTAKVWNEGGISILLAGPPGSGKTMCAEILAIRLDLPIYRIDLSQVVDKYIGQTEKNLKRLFDAADISDTILFFDEADSLFGRRTEVRDSHDRYANLEVSYLLERMERFKGLAILATNRKKDIDDAFLRRLRYVLNFPLPELEERRRIWRQVIPEAVDTSELDIDFLAQFPLSGGHIRSIAFNACLQSTNGSGLGDQRPALGMEKVLIAVKREYDKANRSVSLDQFGPYAHVIHALGESQ